MLNKNYRKYIGNFSSNTLISSEGSTMNIDGTNWIRSDGSLGGLFLRVGSGLTAPTLDDYKLENELALTQISNTVLHGCDDYIKYITTTFKNDTDNIITVNEIGLYTQNTTTRRSALLGRILCSPVTIGIGETYTFSYIIE